MLNSRLLVPNHGRADHSNVACAGIYQWQLRAFASTWFRCGGQARGREHGRAATPRLALEVRPC